MKSTLRLFLIGTLLFVALVVSIGAQDQPETSQDPPESSQDQPQLSQDPPESSQDPPANVHFRIDKVDYEIDGRTRRWALEEVLDIEEGMVFASVSELDAFLERQHQILVNQRVLQDVEVSYEPTGEAEETAVAAMQPVNITITVVDTWNFIVLPYFRYDSNTGLLLSLRARDYNFFGTMQELAIDFDYERTDEEEDLFTIAADFRLPFNLFDRRWELILEEKLELEGGDADFELSTGLGYYFDFLGLEWKTVYTESFRYLTDDPEDDNQYYTSRFDLGTSIDTGLDVPAFGALGYNPNVYTYLNYRPGGISEERDGVSVGFEHALSAGDFDWIGNYRDGQTIELGNNNEYNFKKKEWDRDITFETAVYHAFQPRDPESTPKAGFSTAVSGFYLIDGASEEQDDAVKAARGVLNDTMNGDLGLFFNLDAIVTVWTLEPIFEMQFGTFFDVAYVRDLRGDFYEKTAFDAKRDLRYGAGIEIVGFPLFARSLYVRGSYGVDLIEVNDGTSPLDSEAREIFIGLGHHY